MKNLFLVIVLFFSVVAVSNAQQGVVIKADFGTATLSGSGLGSHSSKFGYGFGVGYNIQANDKFAIEPALKYVGKGATANDKDVHLSYLALPLTLKIYPTESFVIHAGPEVGFLMGANYDPYVATGNNTEFKDEVASADFGVNFGLDYFVNDKLSVGFNGIMGFNDVAETYIVKAKNRMWTGSFNYYLTK